MNILVTGGAGFIGSNFARRLLERRTDCKIVVYDKLTYAGLLSRLVDLEAGFRGRYTFVKGDICNQADVLKVMREHKIDTVVNFAAETHVDRSLQRPFIFVETEVTGVTVLLDSCRTRGVERFVQISTDEVYGDLSFASADESAPLCPRNPYAGSKVGAEAMVMAFHATYGLPVVITRSSNNYGPWQHPEKFMAASASRLLQGQPVRLHGNGLNMRDWIFVEDNCAAVELVMEKGVNGEVYNICAGELHTNFTVARRLLDIADLPEEGFITYVPDRQGNDRRYSMTSHKVRSLDWKPEMSFGEGMRYTYQWYKEMKHWWAELVAD